MSLYLNLRAGMRAREPHLPLCLPCFISYMTLLPTLPLPLLSNPLVNDLSTAAGAASRYPYPRCNRPEYPEIGIGGGRPGEQHGRDQALHQSVAVSVSPSVSRLVGGWLVRRGQPRRWFIANAVQTQLLPIHALRVGTTRRSGAALRQAEEKSAGVAGFKRTGGHARRRARVRR